MRLPQESPLRCQPVKEPGPLGLPCALLTTSPRVARPSAARPSLPAKPHTLRPRLPTPSPATQAPEPHPPQETSHELMTLIRPLRWMETFFHPGMCCTPSSGALAPQWLVPEREPVLGEKWEGEEEAGDTHLLAFRDCPSTGTRRLSGFARKPERRSLRRACVHTGLLRLRAPQPLGPGAELNALQGSLSPETHAAGVRVQEGRGAAVIRPGLAEHFPPARRGRGLARLGHLLGRAARRSGCVSRQAPESGHRGQI